MSHTTFSAEWLRLREPFDHLARDEAARHLDLPAWLAARRPAGPGPWRVIDLACGSGANLRWLAPRLGGTQHWLGVDHDAALLAAYATAPADAAGDGGAGVTIARRALDLALGLDRLPWAGTHLVTASALLDLVGAGWLQQLVAACRGAGAAVLFALSVEGRPAWHPVDPGDELALPRFVAHQGRDKGFGPALGPGAGAAAADALRAAGYAVRSACSDWWLDGRAGGSTLALQRALIDGMAATAIEQDPAAEAPLRAWRARRQAIAAEAMLHIGHLDLIGTPPPGG